MKPSERLDLVNVGWPICLLTYQQRIHQMAPGERIEVRIEDPEVAATIRQLALRQNDRIVQERVAAGKLHMTIRKRTDTDNGKPP